MIYFMVRFEQADARLFANVFVCMKCNAKNRGSPGKKPAKCRKCGSKRLRLKHKTKKTGS
jgi:ribosomal protein L40E